MRQPTKTDYTIEMRDGVVEVIFNPTDSHFQWRYYLRDLVSHTLVNEWHGKTGDTGDYSPRDVVDMAYRLAADHVDKHGQDDPTLTAAAALWSHGTGRGERQARIRTAVSLTLLDAGFDADAETVERFIRGLSKADFAMVPLYEGEKPERKFSKYTAKIKINFPNGRTLYAARSDPTAADFFADLHELFLRFPTASSFEIPSILVTMPLVRWDDPERDTDSLKKTMLEKELLCLRDWTERVEAAIADEK